MTKKTLKLLKNICWTVTAIGMFFLLLNNTKNNPLTAAIFIFTIAGIILNLLEERGSKK